MKLQWFDQPVVLGMESPAEDLIAAVKKRSGAIVVRHGSSEYFAYLPAQLRIKPWFAAMRRKPTGSVSDYLDIDTEIICKLLLPDQEPPEGPGSLVEVDYLGEPIRVAFPGMVTKPHARKSARREPGLKSAESYKVQDAPASAGSEETTAITRYPTIQHSVDVAPGIEVDFTIDLASTPPDGVVDPDIVNISGLPLDWKQAEVTVELSSGHITFNKATDTIVLHRDGTSVACTIHGQVSADCNPGQSISLIVTLLFQNRICGFIRRTFVLGQPAPKQPVGLFGIDFAAIAPVLTIRIYQNYPDFPGRLDWIASISRDVEIPEMPPSLHGSINLGKDPATFVSALYKQLPQIDAGNHIALFHGIGKIFWDAAPPFFQNAYWALRKSLGDTFPIQFITTDPNIPWELMRPNPTDDMATDLLALTHPVARWLGDVEGWLQPRLPAGKIVTVAPQYASRNDQLDRAQDETRMLQAKYSAVPVAGTHDAVCNLLTKGLDNGEVSIFHFAGHGSFGIGNAGLSKLKLQDRDLTSIEVGALDVRLGKKGCLVIFNACETAALGSMLGGIGGWADTLLKEHFGGFIAPLWSVDDGDAVIVVADLFDNLVNRKLSIANALLSIRQQYGKRSPTYLAYLFYGDVGARFAA